MKVLVYSAAIALLVGCMPPQDNRGEVKSFDANACVNWGNLKWGNLKKEYEADLSLINVYGMSQASNSEDDRQKDRSRLAQLAVLTFSSSYGSSKDYDDQAKTASKPRERLHVEDVFIKQIGSDKPAWDLQGLTDVNTPRGYQGTDPLQNLDLAVKMHIKAIIAAQEKLSKIDTLKKHIQKELKQGTNMAHYAGTSTDHEGTSEVHLIVGRDVSTAGNMSAKETGIPAAAKDKYLDEEELDQKYSRQIVSPALLTLFHNGNAYMSDFPAAEARSEDLDQVETLMPGVLNKIAGKYFFGAACDDSQRLMDGEENAEEMPDKADEAIPKQAGSGF